MQRIIEKLIQEKKDAINIVYIQAELEDYNIRASELLDYCQAKLGCLDFYLRCNQTS